MKRITVLLADDNSLVRKEFRRILEITDDLEVVGEAKNGIEAVAMAHKLLPALVLMDICMPLLSGVRATRQIIETLPATKILILSGHSEDAYVSEAMNSGAMGFLVKQVAPDAVCFAIREVHKGNRYFSLCIPKSLRKVKT